MESRPATFRLGLVQTHADAEPAANLERTLALLERAADEGADIVCTQELFGSRYFCQTEDAANFALAEPVPGPTCEALAALAARRGVVIVASLFERRAAGLYHNTAVVFDTDGRLAGRYRKMHVPDDPRFYEKFYFTPGDLGFGAVETSKGRLGVLVCWDQWYPEAARLSALSGAEVLLYPTAIGTWTGERELAPAQHDAWRTVQRAHAITNGVFVAAVNRVGTEGELCFWGRSFVAGPDGALRAEAGDEEAVLVVTCERAAIDRAREGWPFLRDRRIDAYGDLLKRWRDEA
jgi:N-carbamoylputrescine amidase